MVVHNQEEMGEDEAIYKELDDSLVRAATTASSLEAEHDSGGCPRCQETIGDIIAQTRFKNISKTSNDLLLARGNTLRSGEDSLKLNELMKLCTNLQQRVLDLETTMTAQANEIVILKRRVKKLKRRNKSRNYRLKRLYKVGLTARVESSEDEVHTDEDMFGVNDLDDDEVIVDNVDVVKTAEETRSVVEEVTAVIKKAKLVSAAEEKVNVAATIVSTASTIPVSAATTTSTTTVITDDKITLAKALAELKSAKLPTQGITIAATKITADSTRPKAKGIVMQEPSESTPTISLQQPSQAKGQGLKDKGKANMIEPKKPLKKKDQIKFDEEEALRLQVEFDEEDRLVREKAQQEEEANIA
ncbi:hypothetical protein Tco_0979267 [Tanacetum coccineum]